MICSLRNRTGHPFVGIGTFQDDAFLAFSFRAKILAYRFTKDYRPSLKAKIQRSYRKNESGKLVPDDEKPSLIRCTPEALKAAQVPEGEPQDYVTSQLCGQAICPPFYLFNDTPRMRELLKVSE